MNPSHITAQFKGLNKDNPGSWPIAPKLVVLFALIVAVFCAGWFIDIQPQLSALDNGLAKEEKLKKEYVDKYSQAVNLTLYKKQLSDVDQSFGALLKQLPDRSNMESLITDINRAGVGRGLAFDLFKPAPTEDRKEFYAELPISLKVQGTYHQMGLFASDISKLSRIVTLNDLNMSVNKDGLLQMEATAKTFRYLDDEEIAQQRKAEADRKIKDKPKAAGKA